MNKKIAVFSTTWSAEFIGGILLGMEEKIRETGDDLYIFNNYVGYESEEEFNRCEYNIFNLPELDEYDGVLVLSNNIASFNRLGNFYEKIMKRQIPCLCIEQEVEGLHYIGTDNYYAMFELVEHLIIVHGVKTLNYIGGPIDNPENKERERAFRDVLRKYDLEVDENRIRHGKFIRASAREQFDKLKESNLERADAVVCANDEMAIGYIRAASENGISVPEDMIVTGFDNTFIAKGNRPGISSVGRSKQELGKASIEQILGMIDGIEYPKKIYQKHQFCPNRSCGCSMSEEECDKIELEKMKKIQQESLSRWQVNLIQKRLLVCRDEKSLRDTIYKVAETNKMSNFGLFLIPILNENEFLENDDKLKERIAYPKIMEIFAMKWHKNDKMHPIQQTRYVIPEGFSDPNKKGHLYVISPIHMNGINYGYCVLEDGLKYIVENNLFYGISVMDAAFENLRQNIKIRELNRQLSKMYIEDSMTGLYNRFALKLLGEPLLLNNQEEDKKTLFLFADLDSLKVINDTYGHDSGDEAIKMIAQIMKESCLDSTYFCLRYGGDEFLMIGTCKNDIEAIVIQEKIKEKIDVFNATKKLPFAISLSMGHILASSDDDDYIMDEYIKKADKMMFQMKKDKKSI